MSRTCTVCAHPERQSIDEALVSRTGSIRDIAKQYTVSPSSLDRHKAHVSQALTSAKDADEATRATTLLDKIQVLEARLSSAIDQAEAQKDYRAVFSGVREMCALIRLLGEVRGELEASGKVVISIGQPPPELDPDEGEAMALITVE